MSPPSALFDDVRTSCPRFGYRIHLSLSPVPVIRTAGDTIWLRKRLVKLALAAIAYIMASWQLLPARVLNIQALSGIVINNAIVLMDRIDQERAEGRALHDAIIEAGVRRFQPIVMTTCTTAMGLLPIIISRDVLFYDLAVVIAGGLLVGTLLTLVVVPFLYATCFDERSTWLRVRQRKVEVAAG